MNKNALDQLNTKQKKSDKLSDIDNQIIVPNNENINQNNKPMLPPKTPNYGKTPKYLNKYKEEAKAAAEVKEQLK